MNTLDRLFRFGDRVADLAERGVVAIEKLAGTPLKIDLCAKCEIPRRDHPHPGCAEFEETPDGR